MARPFKIIPSRDLHLMIPEDLYARLHLHLFSEADRCVPRGKVQEFFVARLSDFFASRVSAPDERSILYREIYLGLENIYAIATKRNADPSEVIRAVAKWSRIYADRMLDKSAKVKP